MPNDKREVTTMQVRPKDLKRVRVLRAKLDFPNNYTLFSAALDALERQGKKVKVAA
jgi:ribosome-associated translation inhibitor RaiA